MLRLLVLIVVRVMVRVRISIIFVGRIIAVVRSVSNVRIVKVVLTVAAVIVVGIAGICLIGRRRRLTGIPASAASLLWRQVAVSITARRIAVWRPPVVRRIRVRVRVRRIIGWIVVRFGWVG